MIYILHEDANQCAQMLDNEALEKQIKQIAQTLCNAHWLRFARLYSPNSGLFEELQKSIPLKDDKNLESPFSYWAQECRANYLRLVEMGLACCKEAYYRKEEDADPLKRKAVLWAVENKDYAAILWAQDNVPELPEGEKVVCNHCRGEGAPRTGEFWGDECDDCNGNGYVIEPTPFPLCVPDKYIVTYPCSHNVRQVGRHRIAKHLFDIDTVESYRNYYRAKIEDKIQKEANCKACLDGMRELRNCNSCNNGFLNRPKIVKWTRRERPNI